MSNIEKMINDVEELNNHTPNGQIVDADTILMDLIDDCDYQINGLAQSIFDIWKKSTDKESVEELFYTFTDMRFEDYLMKCQEEITR